MIDINLIRNNPEKIQKASRAKGVEIDMGHVLEIDSKHRELGINVQKMREERNRFNEGIKGKPTQEQLDYGKKLKEKLEKEEYALRAVEEELSAWLWKIPNIIKPDVKIGKSDLENHVIRKWKEPAKFSFTPKDHVEIGELLDIIDVKTAAKISGSRFGYLKNEGVLLEFALKQLAFEILIKEGFIPVIPPV